MEQIAVISDIHGNLTALKAVLEDIEKRGINNIICLGDIIAKGINVNECVSLIKNKCNIVLQGNCDRYFTADHNLSYYDEIEKNRILWNKSLLNEESKLFLQTLPYCHEMYISGSLVRFFHASPTADNVTVIVLDKIDEKIKMFEPSNKTITDNNADIVIYGHIHHQFLDKLYNKTLINCGSVGNAFDLIRNTDIDSNTLETTNAHYLIIEGDINTKDYGKALNFNLMRVPYDITKEIQINEHNIELNNYTEELLNGNYRDRDKIIKFFESRNIKFK